MNQLLTSLQARAARSPGDIVLQAGDQSLTVAALLEQMALLAKELRECGARRVALYADNSISWVVADLACQCNGICLVPIPTFFSREQVQHLLRAAAVDQLLFANVPGAALAPELVRAARSLACRNDLSLVPLAMAGAPQIPPGTDKITFTSGSTGQPKGVCLAFEQCLRVAGSLAQAIEVNTPRHLCVLPLSTLLENIGGIYLPLLTGGSSTVLAPEELGMTGSSGIDSGRFLEALAYWQPDTLILVPQLLAVLDGALAAGWTAPTSLKFVAVGGARVPAAVLRRVRHRGVPVYEGYGLTESASVVSLNTPRYHRDGSCGRVLSHVQVNACDGELQVSGNSFLGYLDQPDSWGAKTVFTGDLGEVDEKAWVTVTGRRKNLIITSFGRNVSPEWVESELQADNLFRQVVVLGDGYPCCVALLSPVDPALGEEAIAAAVAAANARLPDYARIGRWLRLGKPLDSDSGLVTENGRPRRARILAHYEQHVGKLFEQSKESLTV